MVRVQDRRERGLARRLLALLFWRRRGRGRKEGGTGPNSLGGRRSKEGDSPEPNFWARRREREGSLGRERGEEQPVRMGHYG